MSDTGAVVVGIDLGTSAVKVVALDASGAVLGVTRRGYPTARPETGAAEQDVEDWWAAVGEALDELADLVPPRRWAGFGLSAMLPTLVEFDGDQPRAPVVTWEDARAEPEGDQWRDLIGGAELYRRTGQRVDGRYLAPMHARLARLGLAGSTVAGAKDALFAALTGRLLTDPSTAAGSSVFDLEESVWDTELVSAARLPGLPVVAPASATEPLLPAWRDRWGLPDGFPVVLGAADSVLGAVGLGATEPGEVAVIAGTSAIVLGISADPIRDPEERYLVTPLTGVGWGLEMDLLTVGSAFDAIATLVGRSGPADLLEAAAGVAVEDAPIFLPYLAPGEQGALWDSSLRGVIHGLDLSMGPAHVARALLTGVVVELRRCLTVLEEVTGQRGPVLLGGGSAQSPLLWQDLADATGREVRVDPSSKDHSAIGAAVFAASALGRPVSVPGSPLSVVPREERLDSWATVAARHDALRWALKDAEVGS